ncbi:hypothetical protein BaRGS_00031627 [Batillaria attramentaria]|uniref:Uncharacterized protein n=1 Tax=Batillaria attramentaria TaxID=370345 RepID=A0ABD0JPZ9_9CAEN
MNDLPHDNEDQLRVILAGHSKQSLSWQRKEMIFIFKEKQTSGYSSGFLDLETSRHISIQSYGLPQRPQNEYQTKERSGWPPFQNSNVISGSAATDNRHVWVRTENEQGMAQVPNTTER